MATVIRPELSIKNKYWVDRHRYYELKHFCLQYPEWKKVYSDYSNLYASSSAFEKMGNHSTPSDITARYAIKRSEYEAKIKAVENAAKEADTALHTYILKAVTEGLSYTYLKSTMGMPCGRDMYYDRYRKFFWILSNTRG